MDHDRRWARVGYVLRKFDFDLAPVVLGLVLAPMLEMALRQSLAMSGGDYAIFLERPIALAMFALGAAVLLAGAAPSVLRRGRRPDDGGGPCRLDFKDQGRRASGHNGRMICA